MLRTCIVTLNFAFLTLLFAAACLAQQPSSDGDKRRETLQTEAAKERTAIGPWKQTATIDSQFIQGFASNNPKIPDGRSNRNIVGFLPGQRLVISDADHPIRVFDCDTGKLLKSFGDKLPDYWNTRQWVSSSSGRLILYLPHESPQIWDTTTGELVATLPLFKSKNHNNEEHDDKYLWAAFLPGDQALATYRGDRNRGWGPDNLQIWDIDTTKKQVTLRQSLTVDKDARGLELIGPYLLIKNSSHNQVLDASTFKTIYSQKPQETHEWFLGLDPPLGDQPGRLITLDLKTRNQEPQIRVVQLPEGKEIARWKCPIEENTQNDHRYQARFTLSPDRKILAISQEGRVNFFVLTSGQKLSTVKANNEYDHCSVQFLNDKQVLLGHQRWGKSFSVCEVSTGKEVASIPESDYTPMVSKNGKYVVANRIYMPLPDAPQASMQIPRPLVVIWRRDEP